MNFGLVSVIVSFGTLIGALLTIVKFWNEIRKRAVSEGMKKQQFNDIIKDVNGIGRKVSDISNIVRDTDKRMSTLEVEIKIKLEAIDGTLQRLEKRLNGKCK